MTRFAQGWLAERDIRAGDQAAGARLRLFCLPHAGSGATVYSRWRRLLGEGVEVCPVLLPGREARLRERCHLDAGALADELAAAAEPYLEVPFAVFGHSMGSLLAYEWARRMKAQPECVFVSGRNAPRFGFGHPGLSALEDEAFIAVLAERYGGMPAGFLEDRELREVFLPVLRADLRMVEEYRQGASAKLACEVMAFAGREDPTVSEAGLQGWSEVTSGRFSARRFPGGHFFQLGEGQAEVVAALRERLAEVLLNAKV